MNPYSSLCMKAVSLFRLISRNNHQICLNPDLDCGRPLPCRGSTTVPSRSHGADLRNALWPELKGRDQRETKPCCVQQPHAEPWPKCERKRMLKSFQPFTMLMLRQWVSVSSISRHCPCLLTWDHFHVVLMTRLVFWSRQVVGEHGWTRFARGPAELWSRARYTRNAAVDINVPCQSKVYEHLDVDHK